MCTLEDFKHLKLDSEHSKMLKNELDLWHKVYLPCGEYPIDIGAGNGETAQFFLNHGAKKVICIEPDPALLLENFEDDPRVTVWPYATTFQKSDCEGGEKNATTEVHFPYRVKILQRSFPYHGAIIRIEEDWGGPFHKIARKFVARALNPVLARIW